MALQRRYDLADTARPSIDPVANSGRGTAQRVDSHGLTAGRRDVVAVMKGRQIDLAPIDEEHTDLVHMGKTQVLARSGNDAGQHEEEGEADGGTFDELAAAPEIAPAYVDREKTLMIGAVVALGAFFLLRR